MTPHRPSEDKDSLELHRNLQTFPCEYVFSINISTRLLAASQSSKGFIQNSQILKDMHKLENNMVELKYVMYFDNKL